jgi:hypothetical protein
MGTDLLALLQEQGSRFLDQDEHVVAAFQAKPRGAGMATSEVGAAPVTIGGNWAGKPRDEAAGAGLRVTSPMALVLTDRRIVVFTGKTSAASGKFTEITEVVSSAPFRDVQSIQVKRLLVGKTVSIAMEGGGDVKLEVPAGNDPKGFAERFEQMKSSR